MCVWVDRSRQDFRSVLESSLNEHSEWPLTCAYCHQQTNSVKRKVPSLLLFGPVFYSLFLVATYFFWRKIELFFYYVYFFVAFSMCLVTCSLRRNPSPSASTSTTSRTRPRWNTWRTRGKFAAPWAAKRASHPWRPRWSPAGTGRLARGPTVSSSIPAKWKSTFESKEEQNVGTILKFQNEIFHWKTRHQILSCVQSWNGPSAKFSHFWTRFYWSKGGCL